MLFIEDMPEWSLGKVKGLDMTGTIDSWEGIPLASVSGEEREAMLAKIVERLKIIKRTPIAVKVLPDRVLVTWHLLDEVECVSIVDVGY